jgi:ribokinase
VVPDAVVVGQVGRDLVLVVDDVPGPRGTVPVRRRLEMLGGKGANQAVALSQLGLRAALVGVVGRDRVGSWALARARRDGIDVGCVVRRAGARTSLIVEVLAPGGAWRYLEDVPEPVLLTEADVHACAATITGARAALLQLQQPSAATLAAGRYAREAGRLVLLDGAPAEDSHRDALLALADVVRADARESAALVGGPLEDAAGAVRAGRDLLRRGPRLVALAVPGAGNVFVWADGQLCTPLSGPEVVDTTGAGDAMIAALTAALLRGEPFARAAQDASDAAAASVGRVGGRPALGGPGADTRAPAGRLGAGAVV